MSAAVQVEKNIVYATHDGEALKGTLYKPAGAGPFPAIVALHGGGWRQANPNVFQFLGPWLAERGYLVFAPVYRSAKTGAASYPKAVHDVRAAVQFVKGAGLGVDASRVALMRESAGGHMAALVGLAGEEPALREGQPQSDFSALSSEVKAIISIYGVFDLVAQWMHDLTMRPAGQNIVELFLGTTPAKDRRLAFEASPLSYAVERLNKPGVFLAWGTQDDIVDPHRQSIPFRDALKLAGFWVRTAIVEGAPHYWAGDPIDEEGSHPAFLAPRLLRFLKARL